MKTLFAVLAAVILLTSGGSYAAEPDPDTIVCRQAKFVNVSIPEALTQDWDADVSQKANYGQSEEGGGDTAFFTLTDDLIASGVCMEVNHVDVAFVGETKPWCVDEAKTACFTIGEVRAKLPLEAGNAFIVGYAIAASAHSEDDEGDIPESMIATAAPCETKAAEATVVTVDDGECQ